jgi:hypothetical protein
LLKETALAATETPWSDHEKNQMRHYVITLVGSVFMIWVLEANFNNGDSWNGCHESSLARELFITIGSVKAGEVD